MRENAKYAGLMSLQPQELLIGPELIGALESHDRIGCELVAEALRAGAEIHVRVMGTSMLPALWPGDILIVRGGLPVTPGEVVLFMRDRRLFAHRVVRHRGGDLITRGDALPHCDPPVQISELLGVMVGVVRHGLGRLPARSPSLTQRIAATAIRHSEFIYRLALGWHRRQMGGTGAKGRYQAE
jgi:signal peptidase